MKTAILSFSLFMILSVGTFANPRLSKKSKAKATTVEQQLSAQISYPNALQGIAQNSVVVVQYKIDDNDRISHVQVQTADKQLNKELTRQLSGLKVNAADTDPEQVYTARLRFQVQ